MSYEKYISAFGGGKFKIVGKYADGGGIDDPIKESRDWVTDWLKNRKTTDEETNKFLLANRNKMIERVSNVNVIPKDVTLGGNGGVYMKNDANVDINNEDMIDLIGANTFGQYTPKKNTIEVMKSLLGNSTTLEHELTHSAMNGLYDDNMKSIFSANTQKINGVSGDTKELIYNSSKKSFSKIMNLAGEEVKKEMSNYISELKNKGFSEEQISIDATEKYDELMSYGIENILEENPIDFANSAIIANNPRSWSDDLSILRSPDSRDIKNPIIFKNEFINRPMESKKTLEYYNNYVLEPDEIHARIMEVRKDLDVKPDQVIDQKFLDDNKEKLNKNGSYIQLRDLLKDGDGSLINLMNKLVSTGKKQNRYAQYLQTIGNA